MLSTATTRTGTPQHKPDIGQELSTLLVSYQPCIKCQLRIHWPLYQSLREALSPKNTGKSHLIKRKST